LKSLNFFKGIFTILVSIAALLFVMELGMTYYFRNFSPIEPVQRLVVSNLTDSAFTLTWWTAKPTLGIVQVGDNAGVLSSKKEASKMHSIDVTGLKPNTPYMYAVLNQYGRQAVSAKVSTLATQELSLPNPAYGKVVMAEGKSAEGLLVTLRKVYLDSNPQVKSNVLTSITNSSGNYLFDLSNVTVKDAPKVGERLEVIVWTADGKEKSNLFVMNQTQPIPTIDLTK